MRKKVDVHERPATTKELQVQKIQERTDQILEITRLEPVVIEVEEAGKVSSHLLLFELKGYLTLTEKDILIDGEVGETVYEIQEKSQF